MAGRDLGAIISRSVEGSLRYGPKFLKAKLADLNLNFLARVFASDNLSIQIRFCVSILLAAKV